MMKKLAVAISVFLLAAPAWANRIFTSGLETNNTTTTEWVSVAATPTISTTQVHSGTYAVQFNAAAEYLRFQIGANKTSGTLRWRQYIYFVTMPSTDSFDLGGIWDSTDTNSSCRVTYDTNNHFKVRNGPTATETEGAVTIGTGTWYRVEVQAVLSDTVGWCELKWYLGDDVSPQETIAIGSANIDTLPTNVAFFEPGYTTGAGTAGEVWMDDFAINDEAGSFQNSYPGPGRIALMKPASDNTVTWTMTGANCTGTTRTNCVDDVPGAPDDLSGYNNTATVQTDRLDVTTLTGPDADDDMTLVDLRVRVGGSTTTGSSTFRLSIWDESGTETNSTGSTAACDVASGTWRGFTNQANNTTHLVLDAGADVKATVESYDIGYEPSAITTNNCRVTALWANVEWIPFTAGSSTHASWGSFW